MSQKSRFTAERLMGGAQRPGSPQETAASYLRSAAGRALPGPIALARVRRRLDASLARAGGAPWRWKTILAVFALGMSLGGATAAAIWGGLPWKTERAPVPAPPAPAIERSQRARAPKPVKPVAPPVETRAPGETRAPVEGPAAPPLIAPPALVARAAVRPASGVVVPPPHARRAPEVEAPTAPVVPAVAPPPAPSSSRIALASPPPRNDRSASNAGSAAPGFARIALSPPSPEPAAPPAPGELAEEARLLGLALQKLHREHDPRASLKTLDDHAARFPHTTLKPEADVTRVEALLALDRRGEALIVLDGMSIPATARGRSLSVVRGELRATAHRCPEAIPDFSRALESSAADALAEKALHGRIACLVAMGENGVARADAQSYLERFPSGRFAPEVRRLLGDAAQR